MTDRERLAVEQAIEYLLREPPSRALAIAALKAALEPQAPRWADKPGLVVLRRDK